MDTVVQRRSRVASLTYRYALGSSGKPTVLLFSLQLCRSFALSSSLTRPAPWDGPQRFGVVACRSSSPLTSSAAAAPTTALPGVHHHHVHPHLSAVHPAHASGTRPLLLPTVCDPSDGHAARHAGTKGGSARRDREASYGCVARCRIERRLPQQRKTSASPRYFFYSGVLSIF